MKFDQQIEIDGVEYVMHQFPAGKALKVLSKLVKAIGEPMAVLSAGANLQVEEVLPKAVHALAEKLDENEVEGLVKDILKSVHYKNVPVSDVFDTHFQGRIGHLFKVLKETLSYQYGNFIEALVGSMQAGPAKGRKSQNT